MLQPVYIFCVDCQTEKVAGEFPPNAVVKHGVSICKACSPDNAVSLAALGSAIMRRGVKKTLRPRKLGLLSLTDGEEAEIPSQEENRAVEAQREDNSLGACETHTTVN
jgi:hypothetical protein